MGEEQGELYQTHLSTRLDQRHPLYVLAEALGWEFFEREFGSLYVEQKGIFMKATVFLATSIMGCILRVQKILSTT